MTDVRDRERHQHHLHASASMPMPISGRTQSHRRRLIRLYGTLTLIGGLALSAIPGPKGSSHTITTSTENGVSTQVHRFSYYRPIGFPFVTGEATLSESGALMDVSVKPGNVLANLVVSLLVAIGLSLFIGRRRR